MITLRRLRRINTCKLQVESKRFYKLKIIGQIDWYKQITESYFLFLNKL